MSEDCTFMVSKDLRDLVEEIVGLVRKSRREWIFGWLRTWEREGHMATRALMQAQAKLWEEQTEPVSSSDSDLLSAIKAKTEMLEDSFNALSRRLVILENRVYYQEKERGGK